MFGRITTSNAKILPAGERGSTDGPFVTVRSTQTPGAGNNITDVNNSAPLGSDAERLFDLDTGDVTVPHPGWYLVSLYVSSSNMGSCTAYRTIVENTTLVTLLTAARPHDSAQAILYLTPAATVAAQVTTATGGNPTSVDTRFTVSAFRV